MATLGFLFAPESAILDATDVEWLGRCCAWMHGTYMARVRAWPKLTGEHRPARLWFDAPSLTSNAATYMGYGGPELRETCTKHVEQKLAEWESQGRPDIVVEGGPADYCAVSQTTSRLGLDWLTGYRGGLLQPVPGKKYALVANQGALFRFDDTDLEQAVAEEITRAYGGASLAMWTLGHTVQIVLWQARQGAQPECLRYSIRLMRPSDHPRNPAVLADLKRGFANVAIAVDWKSVESLLAAAEIGVEAWFAAFGLAGAAELAPKDCAAQWDALDTVGASLLRNEAPNAALVKRLNAVLAKVGEDKVPGKPGKGMARKLFGAAYQLRQASGLPAGDSPWKDRYAAAESYDAIVNSDAFDRLTTGNDKKNIGASASLARLMAYYPEKFYRDGWFWSLAALEAESLNGHAFVGAMETLAQEAHAAGFTLVLTPADQQPAFRKAFGIDGGEAEAERGWSAEAFVDLPGMMKADVADLATAWLAKNKAKGAVVRCEAGGAAKASGDTAAVFGARAKASLKEAARELNPRAAFETLGFVELLAPVPLAAPQEETESSAATLDPAGTEGWPSEVPRTLEGGGADILMLVAVETKDGVYLDQLATDLKSGEKLRTRLDNNVLHLSKRTERIRTADIRRVLGDLPAGSWWAGAAKDARFRTAL